MWPRSAFTRVIVVVGAISGGRGGSTVPANGLSPHGVAQRGINKNHEVIAIGRHLSLMTIQFFDLIKWQ